MKKVAIRSAYSGHVAVLNPTLAPEEREKFRVKQEFKKEVNINHIVSRMKAGHHPPSWMTAKTPRYGDFSGMPVSFMDAYQIVERAEEAFASLPLEFRRELDHDPARLFDAPQELFAKHGLLKQTVGSEAPKETQGRTSRQGDTGDRGPRTNAPLGANKSAKGATKEADDE